MQSQNNRWAGPSLIRSKTAVIALTALAFGCSLYYFCYDVQAPENPKPAASGLHRSNARRRRRGAISRSPPLLPIRTFDVTGRYGEHSPVALSSTDLDFLQSTAYSEEVLADYILISQTGRHARIPLRRELPTTNDLREFFEGSEHASILRDELETVYLTYYFFRHLPNRLISDEQRLAIRNEFGSFGDFSLYVALSDHQRQNLGETVSRYNRVQRDRLLNAQREQVPISSFGPTANEADTDAQNPADLVADTDGESEHSWRGEHETEDGKVNDEEGQGLLTLVYRIAEEQTRKDGYVHRRVTCNACNAMPIRGIRYHCANCSGKRCIPQYLCDE